MALLRPAGLKPGDTVAVLCASSPVASQDHLESGLRAMESVGLKPKVLGTARDGGSVYGYLAGSDAERAADLTHALNDPQYAGVFLACGGYGAQRTLELMDWERVDSAAPGPMVACSGFWQGADEYGFRELMRLLYTPADVKQLTFPDARAVVSGAAEGLTLGGTASLLAASFGTDTSYPARDAILFLEDVDEYPFLLDRILTQIRRVEGYLDGVRGIVLGTFTECGDPELIDRLLVDRFGDLGVPVLAGANIGHNCGMQTYPIGVSARLDADAGTLTFAEQVLADPAQG
ncbi:MAG: LD-carboxypeptidase [Catenulispora sp. 13_1_20CM_3_70_7]|nr:MAG: LD-carboxypeptidase [Catenulispora sp. 13_1_20CM_3_70_7]